MNQIHCPLDETYAEYAYVIKSICDHCGLPSSALRKYAMLPVLDAHPEAIEHLSTVPIRVPLVRDLQPLYGGESSLDVTCESNPCFPNEKQWRGLHQLRLTVDDQKIDFWRFVPQTDTQSVFGYTIHFVHQDDVERFNTAITVLKGKRRAVAAPILPGLMLEDIYRHSIHFLRESIDKKEQYDAHDIPIKRGILLAGKPGCGKTMTCKWLKDLCDQEGFAHKVITVDQYRSAKAHGRVSHLFRLGDNERGIIFFDDMDVMVKDRKDGNPEIYTFLTELDGIEPTRGAVFIFTTNLIKELDEAFVRPGRIDLFLVFKVPSENLRRSFIEQRFSPIITERIDVESLVKRTSKKTDEDEGYTFAELEEIRKLLTLDYISGKNVDLDSTFNMFDKHRKDFAERAAKMGFGKVEESGETDYYGDEFYLPEFILPPSRRKWH